MYSSGSIDQVKTPNDLTTWLLTKHAPGLVGRGGRSHLVTDDVVDSWVAGLPNPNTAIVSLLGRKMSEAGRSEFSYYSFCSEFDVASERGDRPTFQEWLNQNHNQLEIIVREHPTYDGRPVSYETLAIVKDEITSLLSAGRTVVVVDSGGMDRTGRVSRYLGATRFLHANRKHPEIRRWHLPLLPPEGWHPLPRTRPVPPDLTGRLAGDGHYSPKTQQGRTSLTRIPSSSIWEDSPPVTRGQEHLEPGPSKRAGCTTSARA